MNQSIYTEYSNLTPDEIQWLDGCGATWESGEIFSKYKMRYMQVVFNGRVFHLQSLGSDWQKIPTGSEFCERVAEILGIDKPVFGESLLSGDPPTFDEIREANVFGTVSGSAPSDATKEALSKIGNMPVNPAHKTYRVLDSLDGISFDKRIPLSEWIPPCKLEVLFISKSIHLFGEFVRIDFQGIIMKDKDGFHYMLEDGHWMRIV